MLPPPWETLITVFHNFYRVVCNAHLETTSQLLPLIIMKNLAQNGRAFEQILGKKTNVSF